MGDLLLLPPEDNMYVARMCNGFTQAGYVPGNVYVNSIGLSSLDLEVFCSSRSSCILIFKSL